jgi:lysophospholipase L1-like esterase
LEYKHIKSKLYILFVNLAVLLLLLAGVELGSRLLLPGDHITPIFGDQELRIRQRPFVGLHPIRGFALKPGFSDGFYTVDENGFRENGVPGKKKAGVDQVHRIKKTILALGESTTFGWGVQDHETYPARLERFFLEKDAVEVINAGVPSYTSSQVLIFLQEILDQKIVKPDLILINILWNDIWYSTIRNWHPDILVYQQPPGWLSFLTTHSRFCYFLVMGAAKEQSHVNVVNQKAFRQYEKNIEQMIRTCRQEDIELAFVVPPFDADHMPEEGLNEFHVRYTRDFFIQTAQTYVRQLRSIAGTNRVPVIPHHLDITHLHQRSLFMDALHPTAQGNALMARDIYDYVKNQGLLLSKK